MMERLSPIHVVGKYRGSDHLGGNHGMNENEKVTLIAFISASIRSDNGRVRLWKLDYPGGSNSRLQLPLGSLIAAEHFMKSVGVLL